MIHILYLMIDQLISLFLLFITRHLIIIIHQQIIIRQDQPPHMQQIDKQYLLSKLTTILQTLQQDIHQQHTKHQQEITALNNTIEAQYSIIQDLKQTLQKLTISDRKESECTMPFKKIVIGIKNKNAVSSCNLHLPKPVSKHKSKLNGKHIEQQNKAPLPNIINKQPPPPPKKHPILAKPLNNHVNNHNINNFNSNVNYPVYSFKSPKSIPKQFLSKSSSAKTILSAPIGQKLIEKTNQSKMIKSTLITPFSSNNSTKARTISTILASTKSSKSKSKINEDLFYQPKRCINLVISV